jgi:hypothetical protein
MAPKTKPCKHKNRREMESVVHIGVPRFACLDCGRTWYGTVKAAQQGKS